MSCSQVVAAAAQRVQLQVFAAAAAAERDHRIVLGGAARGAADHRLPVGVRPYEPDAPVGHDGVELELVVDDDVERDVDDVAVVAAQIVEPALHVAAGGGQALAAGAAERADQRAGEDRAQIDRQHAEPEQEPVEDLAGIVAEIFEHARARPRTRANARPETLTPR